MAPVPAVEVKAADEELIGGDDYKNMYKMYAEKLSKTGKEVMRGANEAAGINSGRF